MIWQDKIKKVNVAVAIFLAMTASVVFANQDDAKRPI